MPKENRRVKMTKMLLNDSFLKYLADKPLSRITIKEICEDADVNRSTYYTYYTDPCDQLQKLETELLTDMSTYVDSIIKKGVDDSQHFQQILKGLLDYLHSKKHIFQVLLNDTGDLNLEKDILFFFAEHVLHTDLQKVDIHQKEVQEYIFVGAGVFGLVYYWLTKDCEESTDELAKLITTYTAVFRKNAL